MSNENKYYTEKILMLILSLIGSINSIFLTLKKWGFLKNLFCSLEGSSCSIVLNSPWSTLYKKNGILIPLSLTGVLTYFGLFILLILSFYRKNLEILVYCLTLIMSIFSFIFFLIMKFEINAICKYCLLSIILSLILHYLSNRILNRKAIREFTLTTIVTGIIVLIWYRKFKT